MAVSITTLFLCMLYFPLAAFFYTLFGGGNSSVVYYPTKNNYDESISEGMMWYSLGDE
jgi:hypothetical protein|tara:strand:+ start:25 stop:198 length:174 start_codon:yes stop_codon:yes gene_type:complete